MQMVTVSGPLFAVRMLVARSSYMKCSNCFAILNTLTCTINNHSPCGLAFLAVTILDPPGESESSPQD